jgi:signal transduction histidine kinase
VRLRVTDDGCGFDPEQARDHGRPHLGLLGMHERAYSIGGTLDVQSSPGQGTVISVKVPLTPGSLTKPATAPAGPSNTARRAS